MKNHNQGFDMQTMLSSMEPGLDRAILRVLSWSAGRGNAIGREELVRAVEKLGFKTHERAVRICINRLRKAGHMILSTGGINGGYWLAATPAEVDEFVNQELDPRIIDLAETKAAIVRAKRERWGEGRQPSLF